MDKRKKRYAIMEQYVTILLLALLGLFCTYLLAAGFGILWFKLFCAVIIILTSGLCLGYLYLTKELLKRRSLWMGAAAAALFVCTLFSLILNFPCPKP